MKNEYHIPILSEGRTAVDVLAEASGLSRQKVKQSMQKGCVWIEKTGKQNKDQIKKYTQRLRRAKKILVVGDILHFYYDDIVLKSMPSEAKLISDQGGYSIWSKPVGMLSQGSKWGDHCTIYRWAEKNLQPERTAFIVHRLDRAAKGLIILAHTKQLAASFANLFQKHEIEKYYRVTVEGDFSSIILPNETQKVINSEIEGKAALSYVRFISYNKKNDESKLEVQIETGRKHQIRKHLVSLNFPVVGDRLYGSGKSLIDLKLEAMLLKFSCPMSGEKMLFELKD